MYESWEECAKRETKEETGLTIDNVRFGHVTNDIMKELEKHYITIFMMGEVVVDGILKKEYDGGDHARVLLQPMNLEPHKCDGWHSYSWEELRHFASSSINNYCAVGTTTNCYVKGGADEIGGDREGQIVLFGPLLQLVEAAPSNVVDFIDDNAA